MKRRFRRFAHSLFGRYFREKKDEYRPLERDLISSRIGISVDQWLSTTVLTSLLVTLFSVPCLCVLLLVIGTPPTGPVIIAGIIASITVLFTFFFVGRFRPRGEVSFQLVDERRNEKYFLNKLILVVIGVVVIALVIAYPFIVERIVGALANGLRYTLNFMKLHLIQFLYALIPIVSFLATSIVFNLYPRVRTWERRRRIDGLTGPAVSLMGSVAGVGLTPYDSMKFLAEEEAYGEMSEEMEYLIRDVDLFGMDLVSALRKLSGETASEKLKSFLQGMITTITSGGNLRKYLMVKSEEYSRRTEKELSKYVDSLGLIAEMFLVAGVVAPTLITIVLAMIAIMGGTSIVMIYVVILMIPGVTFLVTLAADSLEPPSMR